MPNRINKISDDFWNIRSNFRIGGVVNIGTQASLVRRPDGMFVLLDCCELSGDVKHQINVLTNDGEMISTIINLHPFHTIHVPDVHRLYPHAALYGSARHQARAPELAWADMNVEDEKFGELFKDVLEFSIPRGVDFISENDNVHFSSVLALHRASGTIHVDDTLMYLRAPLGVFKTGLRFHPTLPLALERRAGAAEDFRAWARELAENWGDAVNLCAAHNAALTGEKPLGVKILKALKRAEIYLKTHELRHR